MTQPEGGFIEADLVLDGAAEVVTFRGVAAGRDRGAVSDSVLADATVAVAGGRMVFIGPAAEARNRVRLRPGGERLDCRGQVILPGLIDPHTHLPFAGSRADEFRRRLGGATYEEIAHAGGGILATVRATRAAADDELISLCRARFDCLLLHGVTVAEVKSGYGLSLRHELRQLELVRRAGTDHPLELVPTLLAAHVLPPEFSGRRQAYVELITDEILPAVAAEHLARFCDVFVDEGAFTPAEARIILEAARAQGLGLRLHVDQLAPGGGAELAAALGASSADHLEHASAAGMAALAAAGTVAVLIPAVNLFLRKRVMPDAVALMEAGVAVALATDCNPGSCLTENLPLCASLACMTTGMDTDEALAGITVQAARSLGLLETHGVLDSGRPADLAVFAVADRTAILYHFGINHCRTVIKGGQVVVRQGQPSPR